MVHLSHEWGRFPHEVGNLPHSEIELMAAYLDIVREETENPQRK